MSFNTSARTLDNLRPDRSGIFGAKHGDLKVSGKSLFIGLGGSGARAVCEIKKRLIKDCGSINPEYVQFRIIDNDSANIYFLGDNYKELICEDELCLVDASNIEHCNTEYIKKIIPNDSFTSNNGISIYTRLGAICSLMIPDEFRKVVTSLEKALKSLYEVNSRYMNVYIVAGLGGFFGSSAAIHIPYILREIVDRMRMNISSEDVGIHANLMLPGCYLKAGANMSLIENNSYAALKEIDYYMNLVSVGECFEAEYPGEIGRIRSSFPVYSSCTLFDNSDGDAAKSDPMADAIAAITDNVILKALDFECVSPDFDDTMFDNSPWNFAKIANQQAAIATVIDTNSVGFPRYGRYNYTAFGSNSVKIPIDELNSVYAGKAIEQAEHILVSGSIGIDDSKVSSFESAIGIKPTDLLLVLKKSINELFFKYLDSKIRKWNEDIVNTGVVDYILGECLQKELRAFDRADAFTDNIISNLEAIASNVFVNPEMGPYHLRRILNAKSELDGFSGLYERFENYIGMIKGVREFCDEEKAVSDVMTATDKIIGITVFGKEKFRKKELLGFIDTYVELYTVRYIKGLCDIFEKRLYSTDENSIISRSKAVLDKYIERANLLESTVRIVSDNGKYAKKIIDDMLNSSSSIYNSGNEEFVSLGHFISFRGEGQLAMLQSCFDPCRYIADISSSLICGALNTAYECNDGTVDFGKEFRAFLISYDGLKEGYLNSALELFDLAFENATLGDKVRIISSLIDYLVSGAFPRFNMRDSYTVNKADLYNLRCSSLILPQCFSASAYHDDSWKQALAIVQEELEGRNDSCIMFLGGDNCSFNYVVELSMLPLYLNSSVADYEKTYETLKTSAVHINESSCLAPALRDYPSVIPMSQYSRFAKTNPDYSNESEEKMMKKLYSLFDDGHLYSILRPGDEGYGIMILEGENGHAEGDEISALAMEYLTNNVFENNIDYNAVVSQTCKYVWEAYGKGNMHHVHGIRAFNAENRDNTVLLLRRQMKNFRALEKEVEFFKEFVVKKVDEYTANFTRI